MMHHHRMHYFNHLSIKWFLKLIDFLFICWFLCRLLSVSNTTLLNVPTIVKLRTLFDNYELDTMTIENETQAERREEDEFLDKVLDTAVMKMAMRYLQQKGVDCDI